jgi:hypothetical protein
MEQASKKSSSYEEGLLLDPLHKHKGTGFSLLPKDREDRTTEGSRPTSFVCFRFSITGCPPFGHTGTGDTNRKFITGYFVCSDH